MQAATSSGGTAFATLDARLLGGFRLAHGGAVVTVDAPRLQSLLAHLLLNREDPVLRERLAYLFWPESEESQARTNLRQTLHHLRRALPDAECYLEINPKTVRWRGDAPFTLDVAEFEELLGRALQARESGKTEEERSTLEETVSRYTGDLLPDCYDDWIVPERERLLDAFLAAGERLANLLESGRDYRSAVRWARRLLDNEPLNEKSCRRLMRLQALAGDRAGALRVYHGFATALARETGVEPSGATRETYERLLEAGGVAVGSGRPFPQPRSRR